MVTLYSVLPNLVGGCRRPWQRGRVFELSRVFEVADPAAAVSGVVEGGLQTRF